MAEGRYRPLIPVAVLLGLAVWSAASLGLDAGQLLRGWGNLEQFLARAVPPDASVLNLALSAMVETLQMAFLGTLLAAVAALPLAVLASRNLFPGVAGVATRVLLASLRSMPAILWALILVAVVGLGPLAGVLALAVYTIGVLGKLEYEAIEGLPREPIEALEANGATRLEVIRHVVLPEAANSILSHLLFVFEYNVRHAAVLGIVGAGGIGALLMGYLQFFQLDKLVTVLLVILATILLIDSASRVLRRRFTEGPALRMPADPASAPWAP